MIEIRKYRHTRHWAVYVDGELLAVVGLPIADCGLRIEELCVAQAVSNPQSAIGNPQSAIRNLQSAICNPTASTA